MLFHTYTLTDTITYSSGATVSMDVPKNGYITQLDCYLLLNVTGAATVVAATDALAKMITGAEISAAGQTYFDCGDGREWWYWTYFRHKGQITSDSLPSASATSNVRTLFEVHLGFEPQRTPSVYMTPDGRMMRTQIGGPFDPTVVIPAVRLSNPQLQVTFGTNSTLGTGYTINSGTLYTTIHELVLESGERESDIWPNGLLVPRVESASESLATAHTNKGLRHEVPVSLVLYQTLGLVLNGSDDRSDSVVSEVSVEFPPQRETPVDYDWYDLKLENRKRTEVGSDIAGAYLLEWPLVSGNELGIDLSDKRVGDVEIGLSNSATASAVARFLHIGYLPE